MLLAEGEAPWSVFALDGAGSCGLDLNPESPIFCTVFRTSALCVDCRSTCLVSLQPSAWMGYRQARAGTAGRACKKLTN